MKNKKINHKQLLEKHEWNKYFKVDIMDEKPEEDIEVAIPDGFKMKRISLVNILKIITQVWF